MPRIKCCAGGHGSVLGLGEIRSATLALKVYYCRCKDTVYQ